MGGHGKVRAGRALLVALALLAACEGDEPNGDATEAPEGLRTDVGVTQEPCPDAVNRGNGCIYLGILSDLSVGPFAALAQPLTDAQHAFWDRVNDQGGIGGYDIDTRTYTRDNRYDPELHEELYREIRGEVLALAQTLGSAHTGQILDELEADDVLAVPVSWTSAWAFESHIVASGASYCVEAMNAVDHAFDTEEQITSVLIVHYEGDYGEDAAGGAGMAAAGRGADVVELPTVPGADQQAEIIDEIVTRAPGVLYLATGPLEMATIVAQAAARGYNGLIIGAGPTWNPALLQTPAGPALQARYWQAAPWAPYGADSAGHRALREAIGDVEPNDGHTSGWVLQYPLRAAIEAAVDAGDLTRAGLRRALQALTEVDYEGVLPPEAGVFTGGPDERAFRQSVVNGVDPEAPTGLVLRKSFFAGPTAQGLQLTAPCFQLR